MLIQTLPQIYAMGTNLSNLESSRDYLLCLEYHGLCVLAQHLLQIQHKYEWTIEIDDDVRKLQAQHPRTLGHEGAP